jgi:hypothetical protein
VGDVVICPPAAGLTTYPDEAIDDRDELLRSARRLSQLDFDALLLCDGEPVVNGGKERLLEFVDASGLDQVGLAERGSSPGLAGRSNAFAFK